MKIELKNIQAIRAMSEETECFHATVWIDGIKAGEASNDGHGACNMYHPWELGTRLEEYAKTLPEEKVDMGNGKTFMMQPSADTVIGDALGAALASKDLKRLLSSKIVYTVKGKSGIFATKKLDPIQVAKVAIQGVAVLPPKWNVDQCLNSMPFEEALKLYRTV